MSPFCNKWEREASTLYHFRRCCHIEIGFYILKSRRPSICFDHLSHPKPSSDGLIRSFSLPFRDRFFKSPSLLERGAFTLEGLPSEKMRRSVGNVVARSIRLLEQQSQCSHVFGNSTTSASASLVAPFSVISRNFADASNLLKTPLYDFHVENGGMYQSRGSLGDESV